MSQWYFAKGKSKNGPYSFEQMKQLVASGQVRPGDMVLQDGTTKWAAASTVDGLFQSPAAQPKLLERAKAKWRAAGTPAKVGVTCVAGIGILLLLGLTCVLPASLIWGGDQSRARSADNGSGPNSDKPNGNYFGKAPATYGEALELIEKKSKHIQDNWLKDEKKKKVMTELTVLREQRFKQVIDGAANGQVPDPKEVKITYPDTLIEMAKETALFEKEMVELLTSVPAPSITIDASCKDIIAEIEFDKPCLAVSLNFGSLAEAEFRVKITTKKAMPMYMSRDIAVKCYAEDGTAIEESGVRRNVNAAAN